MKAKYLKVFEKIINNYDEYMRTATYLEWVDNVIHNIVISKYESSIHFCMIEFPVGYLENHFQEAFVQLMLSVMAYNEEFDLNFWKDFSYKQRNDILNTASTFYREYISIHQCEIKEMTYHEFEDDIYSWFPKQLMETVPDKVREAKEILELFLDAEAVWLGGNGCVDENWIAVCEDRILYVNFGCSA